MIRQSSKSAPIASRKALSTWTEGKSTFYMVITSELAAFPGQKPYFSTTATIRENGREYMAGRCHDEILKRRPDFADVIKLHLSDEDGKPMHALSNAWYWMAGALGGAGQEYHGASGSSAKTTDECLQIWADHVRMSLDTATRYRDMFAALYVPQTLNPRALMDAEYGPIIRPDQAWRENRTTEAMARRVELNGWRVAHAFHDRLIDGCAPRWKSEAEAAKQFLQGRDPS